MPKKQSNVIIRAVIPKQVLAKLEARAAKEGHTLSSLVRFLLTKVVEGDAS